MTDRFAQFALGGCRPTPLAAYLKALGILRLVAEQADPDVRGWWKNGVFQLRSRLDAEGLTEFFRESYQPSPIVGPWGGRSGFFPGSSEKAAREALSAIAASDDVRVQPFRELIQSVHQLLADLDFSEKPKDDKKLQLMTACRNRLPDSILPWLDATYILTAGGRKFPPLLGTGGNEGAGSYMSGFAQQVVSVIVERNWDHAVGAALFGDPAPNLFTKQTPGHFSPEAAGGANAGTGFEASVGMNPWDYLLTLEGTLMFAAACVRQLERRTAGVLGYPFCVRQAGRRLRQCGGQRREELAGRNVAAAVDPPEPDRRIDDVVFRGTRSSGKPCRPRRRGLRPGRSATGDGPGNHRVRALRFSGTQWVVLLRGPAGPVRCEAAAKGEPAHGDRRLARALSPGGRQGYRPGACGTGLAES